MVSGGLKILERRLDPCDLDVLWVENVGNLVCPAEFEVGEDRKVALLSVTEGEDKPLKYPIMFREADCILITKTDLVPHLSVDPERIEINIRSVNPHCTILRLSASTGEGFSHWYQWILDAREVIRQSRRPALAGAGVADP
jgi:hydrogenase nickel incorporation protein HypB